LRLCHLNKYIIRRNNDDTYVSPAGIPQTCTAVLISIAQCRDTVHRRKMSTKKAAGILSFQYSTGAFHGSKIHRIGISSQ
jgi:hypothetical protein